MALPVTISGVQFPLWNSYCGPFLSGGSIYTVLLNSLAPDFLEVHKATDPTDSFTEQDIINKPNLVNVVRSMWVFQDGTDLHIVHQENATERLGYTIFRMATDLWDGTVVDEEVEVPTGVTTILIGTSIALRSDGDVIVLYAGSADIVHGSPHQRVDYARREGGSWTVGIAVDDGGVEDWIGSVIVIGSSDRMHFFFKDGINDDVFQRTLLSDNSLETFPSAGDLAVAGTEHVFVPGISYDDGGTQRIRCPYEDASGQISYAEFDSADAPGAFTINANVGDNTVRVVDRSPAACLSVDEIDEHLLYVDSTDRDLYHDKNDGVDVEILNGVTMNRISSNVYDRSGTKLAFVYEDVGTIRYNEVDIAVTSSFSGSDFPNQNYYVGPFSGSL